jgi:hypothetical protein
MGGRNHRNMHSAGTIVVAVIKAALGDTVVAHVLPAAGLPSGLTAAGHAAVDLPGVTPRQT